MKRNCLPWVFGLLTALVLANFSVPQEPFPAPKFADPIQVQTRGPVHDAMAHPVTAQPVPGPVVPKEPPPNISEDPPAQKPDIDNVQWVPGYWAWDPPQQQFLWISGCTACRLKIAITSPGTGPPAKTAGLGARILVGQQSTGFHLYA